MAQPATSATLPKSLDTLRDRLSTLSKTLGDTQEKITTRDPLPTWPQLSALQNSLAFTLGQLNETLTLNAQTLKEAHVYPTSSFPGHKDGDVMEGLLRKQLDVKGEEWIGEYTTVYKEGGAEWNRGEIEGLWTWAGQASHGIVMPLLEEEVIGDDFTIAEREAGVDKVRTGLRRKLWEYEEESEDEGGEEMEEEGKEGEVREGKGVDPNAKPLSLESLLRFATTGAMPAMPNR